MSDSTPGSSPGAFSLHSVNHNIPTQRHAAAGILALQGGEDVNGRLLSSRARNVASGINETLPNIRYLNHEN